MMEHHDYPAQVRDTLARRSPPPPAVLDAQVRRPAVAAAARRRPDAPDAGRVHRRPRDARGRAVSRRARHARPARAVRQRDAHRHRRERHAENRYQGIVPLTGASMSDCLRAYFEQSSSCRRACGCARRRERQRAAAAASARHGAPVRVTESGRRRAGGRDRGRLATRAAGGGHGDAAELAELDDRSLLRRLFAETTCACSSQRRCSSVAAARASGSATCCAPWPRGSRFGARGIRPGRGALRILQPRLSLRHGGCDGAVCRGRDAHRAACTEGRGARSEPVAHAAQANARTPASRPGCRAVIALQQLPVPERELAAGFGVPGRKRFTVRRYSS